MRYAQLIILSVIFAGLQVSAQTGADNDSGGRGPRQGKVYTIDFEDELVEGGLQKPDLFYLLQKKNFNFKKLIRLRENFLPEIKETSEHLPEAGGNR